MASEIGPIELPVPASLGQITVARLVVEAEKKGKAARVLSDWATRSAPYRVKVSRPLSESKAKISIPINMLADLIPWNQQDSLISYAKETTSPDATR